MGFFGKYFGKKAPKVFEDDDQFAQVYDVISKSHDIVFETDDNKSFTGEVGDKLWMSIHYWKTFDGDMSMSVTVRAFKVDAKEGDMLYKCTYELNFSEANNEKLQKLVDVKIDEWRVKNLERVEAERKESITNRLNA